MPGGVSVRDVEVFDLPFQLRPYSKLAVDVQNEFKLTFLGIR